MKNLNIVEVNSNWLKNMLALLTEGDYVLMEREVRVNNLKRLYAVNLTAYHNTEIEITVDEYIFLRQWCSSKLEPRIQVTFELRFEDVDIEQTRGMLTVNENDLFSCIEVAQQPTLALFQESIGNLLTEKFKHKCDKSVNFKSKSLTGCEDYFVPESDIILACGLWLNYLIVTPIFKKPIHWFFD